MTTAIECDVVVVGAGLAGLVVANRVAEAGLTVRVLEKSIDDAYLCNSRYTGGLFHVAMDDMTAEPHQVRANLERATRGTTKPELADALALNARRTLRWLSAQGVRLMKAGPDGLRRNALAPPGMRKTGLNWRGRSGDVMLRTLGDRLAGRGGVLMRGVTAEHLVMDGSRCAGLQATMSAGGAVSVRARAVVLADGGFQGNPELVRRFISARPERILQRNAGTGIGCGLLMAEAVGAKLVGTDRFYGHVQHRLAMTDGGLWPYPVVDSLCTAAMVVDGSGQRFCDEGLGGVFVTNAIAKLEDPLSAVIIFDDAIWNGPGRDWILPANPYLIQAGGNVISAPTIVDLAKKISLDPVVLQRSVEHYNAMVDRGASDQGQPERTTAVYKPWPIKTGPFHAIEVCAGLTYTMGGIATNAHAAVLDCGDRPIPGLYAAGSTTGGLEGGGAAAGYSGGLSKASVFGLLAGDAIVSELQQKQAERLAS